MPDVLAELIAANVTFVGTHFAMSHPLRAPMVRLFGEKLFPAIYSIVSAAALAWVYFAFKAMPSADLGGSGTIGWVLATVLMIPAMILLAGSFAGNPALPHPGAEKQAHAEPKGVFKVTRHPMMWAFGLWALSHMLLFWSTRTMITAGSMGFLALVGAHMQDLKKRVLMGDAWDAWESKTSYWPRLGAIFSVGWLWWAIGIALWLVLSWAHIPADGIPAGVFRWIG